MDIVTGKVLGMEALVRWSHPGRGLISPGLFIPLAEEIGLIADLGNWVMARACNQAKAWKDGGFGILEISVNVSAP